MDKAQQFWDWFKNDETKYLYLNQIDDENERESLLNIFLEHLHNYCKELFFEMGGLPDAKQDLIITAGGNSDFFDEVELLVSKAPELEYWNVIALKPAQLNGIVEYGNIILKPEEMFFNPLSSNRSNLIGLRIYLKNYSSFDKDQCLEATYILLDNLIGEKSTALDIGHVELEDLHSVHDIKELIEMNKLPKYVKWKQARANA
jgi:hypothetical protein